MDNQIKEFRSQLSCTNRQQKQEMSLLRHCGSWSHMTHSHFASCQTYTQIRKLHLQESIFICYQTMNNTLVSITQEMKLCIKSKQERVFLFSLRQGSGTLSILSNLSVSFSLFSSDSICPECNLPSCGSVTISTATATSGRGTSNVKPPYITILSNCWHFSVWQL